MEVRTEEAMNLIVRMVRGDLNNLAEVRIWDQLSTYGKVSLFYMNHPNADYRYTCYVNDQYNTCGDYVQKVMAQTLYNIETALWHEAIQPGLF